jgi:hypothetical protein
MAAAVGVAGGKVTRMKTIWVRDVRRWRNVTSCDDTVHNVSYVSVGHVLQVEKQCREEEVQLYVFRMCLQRTDTPILQACV